MKIGVIGSVNVDIISKTKMLPNMGETIIGDDFLISFGGKGANEAVASARIGASTTLFACVGDDMFSKNSIANLLNEKVHVSAIKQLKNEKCGFANIILNNGNNQIIVVPGANDKLDEKYIKNQTTKIKECDVVGCQFEVSVNALLIASRICNENNIKFVLNPSPIKKFPNELLSNSTYIIVNEHEIQQISEKSKMEAEILSLYPNKLILTKGSDGVFFSDGEKIINIPAIKVNTVDTTGAGDTFLGTFMVGIASGLELIDTIKFANVCAGLKTIKMGAQTGMPTLKEVKSFIKKNKIEIKGVDKIKL